MAHPKRRSSKQRHRLRRTHFALTEPAMAKCPRCGAVGRPHVVCENCGYYKGRKVLAKDEF